MQVPNPPGSSDALMNYAKGTKSGEVVLGTHPRRGSLKDNYGQVDESM